MSAHDLIAKYFLLLPENFRRNQLACLDLQRRAAQISSRFGVALHEFAFGDISVHRWRIANLFAMS